MTPVPAKERIVELDVLRGFALSGVLVVNMSYDFGPAQTALDRGVEWLIHQLASGAFYPIFSFLFGAGFALQLDRAVSRGSRFPALYTRRLTMLLFFGLAHMAFLWWGDILHLYAILGLVLLLFRSASRRVLLICALLCGSFSAVEERLLQVMHVNRLHVTSEATAKRLDAELTGAYKRGSYAAVAAARIRWMPVTLDRRVTDNLVPNVLGLFLLGALAARSLLPVREHTSAIRRASVVAGAIALVAGAARLHWPNEALLIVFKTALAGFYAAAVVLLIQRPAWRHRLRPFASVGRMALTNYILQSVVFTILLYHYGFGQYKVIRPAFGFGFAAVVFLFQIALSHWWVAHFRQGPLEWIWRALTYAGQSVSRAAAGG